MTPAFVVSAHVRGMLLTRPEPLCETNRIRVVGEPNLRLHYLSGTRVGTEI